MPLLSKEDLSHFQNAIARVDCGSTSGTAFFVLPGVLLSCLHVVQSKRSVRLTWNGLSLTLQDILTTDDPNIDLVSFRVAERDHPLLPLGITDSATGEVMSYGFQHMDRGYEGYPVWGKYGGRALERVGSCHYDRLVVLDANIQPGLSGAPLLSLAEKRVIGVVKRSNPDGGGYAVPIEHADMVHPGLLEENRACSSRIPGFSSPRAEYMRSVEKEHTFVHLPFAVKTLHLEDVYTTVSLSTESVSGCKLTLDISGRLASTEFGIQSKMSARRDLGSPHRPYLEAEVRLQELVSQPKSIVLGDPGSGKTTLFRHLTVRACRGEILSTRLPVFVKANDLTDSPGCLLTYFEAAYPSFVGLLRGAMEVGQIVLFLDGLDEVSKAQQDVLERELRRFSAVGNQVLVSCRRAAFPRGLFSTDYKVYECVGFNRAQQRRFIRSWFAGDTRSCSLLDKEIRLNAEMAPFFQNPLLLSLMCVVLEHSTTSGFPVSRVELYREAIYILISKRDGLRVAPRIDRELLLSCLRKLAFQMFQKREETFSATDLRRVIEGVKNDDENVHPTDSLINALVDHSGLLTTSKSRHYRFLHLTFQEYLAAEYVVEQADRMLLAEHVDDPRWEEVLRLSASLFPPDEAQALLDLIWRQGCSATPEAVALAGRCASDVNCLSPDYVRELVVRLTSLMYSSEVTSHSDGAIAALAGLCVRSPSAMDQIVDHFWQMARERLSMWNCTRYIHLLGFIASKAAFIELTALYEHFSLELKNSSEDGVLQIVGALGNAIGHTEAQEMWVIQCEFLKTRLTYLEGIAGQVLDVYQPEDAKTWLRSALDSEEVSTPLAMYLLSRYEDVALTKAMLEKAFCLTPDRMAQAAVRAAIVSETPLKDTEFVRELFHRCEGTGASHLLEITPLFLRFSEVDWVARIVTNGELPLSVRAAAINLLVTLHPDKVNSMLVNLFSNNDVVLQRVAIASLSSAGVTNSLEFVLRALKPDSDYRVVRSMLVALSSTPLEAARPWLLRVIKSESDPDIRLKALLSLAATRAPETIEIIKTCLRSFASTRERVVAFKALGFLQSESAARLLLRSLPSETDIVAVTQIIESLGSYKLAEVESRLTALLVPETWPDTWPKPLPPLRQGEQRPSDRRRLATIISLDKLASSVAVSALRTVVACRDEAPEVREAANTAVRNILWLQGMKERR